MKSIGSMLLAVACLSLLLATACSRKPNRTTKVTVGGEALTKVEPDAAVVVLSVVTQHTQAITAQQENARKSEAVAAAIKNTRGRTLKSRRAITHCNRNTIIATTSCLRLLATMRVTASS